MIRSPGGPKPRSRTPKRILAIAPISRGFGFVVLEGTNRLVDWGVVHVRTDKQSGCLRRINGLIDFHQPSKVVTEDVSAKGSRRCSRVVELIAGIRTLSRSRGLESEVVAATMARRSFIQERVLNKYEIAEIIAARFTELRPYLPKRRKCYESEDEQISIFDALALWWAIAC